MSKKVYKLIYLLLKPFLNRFIWPKIEQIEEDLKFQIAAAYFNQLNYSTSDKKNIKQFEYKVYSQWGQDGIIQFLINHIEIANKTFIEFGVQNYRESNTRFLLKYNNWKGLVIDGSKSDIDYIQNDFIYWQHEIDARSFFITRENINQIIKDAGFIGEIGILNIDIDGNDYFIWETIDVVNPIIVIIEYNSVFGKERTISVPYKSDFYRTNAHYSNLYFGASIAALNELGKKKGYSLIYCNSAGNDAFFVRNDKLNGLNILTPQDAYVESKGRESRDSFGKKTFISGKNREDVIKGLEVLNVITSKIEVI